LNEDEKNEDEKKVKAEEEKNHENEDDEKVELLDDLEGLILQVVGDNKVGTIISFILSILKVLLTDLLFICFFASQELMDSSCIHVLNMKPIYKPSSIIFAIFFGKLITHIVLVCVVYFVSAKLFTVYEGHAIGVIVIFFICAYEFMFNVLFNLSTILDLPLDQYTAEQTAGA